MTPPVFIAPKVVTTQGLAHYTEAELRRACCVAVKLQSVLYLVPGHGS